MAKQKSIDVSCQCGRRLARYRKGGKGRLVKMFFDRILVDHAGIFLTAPPRPLHDEIRCPGCGTRVATVQIIRGRYAAKINRGGIARGSP